MPTPVSTARQCLTDEAARALDAAAAIARRRSHTQTTSLHALSALLSLPSSPLLRDACSRSHCTPYSPRLQFRALELCVGVSLDRLPTAKTSTHHHQPDHHEDDNHNSPPPSSSPPPPISNSLMAAIKRSQANQRRQPEMYQITHFHHSNPSVNPISSISAIKVEVKNFVVSILDDPIVSRVLGEAGFRSHDIKLAILHPPVPPPSSPADRFLRAAAAASRFTPPLLSVPFPFATAAAGEDDSGGYYSRRIGEILVKRSGSGRNPLLVGVCAREALTSFRECVEQRKPGGLLPTEVTGVGFACLEKEIQGFVTGCEGREKIESKIDELDSVLEKHGGPGLVVSYGDLKVLVADDPGGPSDSTKFVVSKLSGLVERFKEKLWLIGWAACSDTCKKFQEQFPSLENEWDLQSLPVTSSRSTVGGLYSKSSLMGSFVPFGGFFSSPSEFRNNHPVGVINPSPSSGSSSRCALCNEKCNQELFATKKSSGSSSISFVSAAADRCSSTLPSWLQTSNTSKPQEEISEKAAESNANADVLRLQEKWNEICQRLHHPLRTPNNPELSITSRSQVVPCSVGFLNAAHNSGKSISDGGNPLPSDRLSSSLDSGTQIMVQKSTSSLQSLAATPAVSASLAENVSEPVSVTSISFAYHSPNRNLPNDHKSPSSVSSVTTDLGLGATLHAASTTCQEPKIIDSSHVGGGVRGKFSSTAPSTHPPDVVIAISSKKSVEGSDHYKRDYNYVVEDLEDYKQILKKLTERVPWQVEACQNISRVLSSFRSGRKGNNGHGSPFNQQRSARGLWMVLSGPDKIGKKKLGSAIADVVFGSRESLIAVDLSSQDKRVVREPSNLIFDSSMLLLPNDLGVRSGRKTVVDYLVDELRRKPHSVVVMENVDQSDDLVVQRSLSRAIQTGRLPDSHGREISISNAIFVMTTCSSSRENDDGYDEDRDRPQMRFIEERVLDAQIWQMKIAVERVDDGERNFNHNNDKRPRVVVMDSNRGSHHHVSKRRRSHSDVSPSMIVQKKTRRCLLDLNVALPVEEIDESTETDSSFPDPCSRAWWAEFEHLVEEKVEFKTVHFNMMAAKLMNLISGRLERILGEGVGLEIDEEAMVMMLGAAWSSEKEGVVEGWVEEVLGGAFMEARRRHCVPECGSSVILKLVSCPGNRVDKLAPGICLPGSINLG